MVALARLLLESGVVLAEEGPVGGIQAFEGEGAGEREEAQRSKKVHNVIMASFPALFDGEGVVRWYGILAMQMPSNWIIILCVESHCSVCVVSDVSAMFLILIRREEERGLWVRF